MGNLTTRLAFYFGVHLFLTPLGWSQYIIDQDLGSITFGATVTISGDTSAAGGPVRNAAGFHENITSLAGNWGHERVYRFEVTEPLF